MTSSDSTTLQAFTDAAADAVARAIAGFQREAQRERDLREAEHRALVAELNASKTAFADLLRQVTEKLATLKDGEPGRSVTIEEIEPLIDIAASRAVSQIPVPKDGDPGKDADPALIAELVDARVAEAVSAIPIPKDGDPGKDADPALIRQMVEEAVSAIPPAEPGKDADPDAIRQMVAEAVAAIPAAEPGRDVDMELVAEQITSEVERVLSGWEKPKNGESVMIDDVRPLVGEAVTKAVSELPKPKDGEPGKLPIVTEWTDAVHYAGDVRSHQGSTWQAVRDTAKEPPHDDWICIARGGSDGRSFAIRGTYNPEEAYRALDVVALNGASFAARKDGPGPCPGEDWQLVAGQGKQGKPGPKGDPGIGKRGEPGLPVVAIHVDERGALELVNGDGTVLSADLYELLSRL